MERGKEVGEEGNYMMGERERYTGYLDEREGDYMVRERDWLP